MDKNLLGEFMVSGIAPALRGVNEPLVTFDIDADGILNVCAEDQTGGSKNQITITNDNGRLSKVDIDTMIEDAKKYKIEDEYTRGRLKQARNALEDYAYKMRNTIGDKMNASKLVEANKKKIGAAFEQAIKWLQANQHVDEHVFNVKKKELECIFNPMHCCEDWM